MMEAFLSERFPFVSADDAIQETLVALARAIPNYRYDPGATGLFRSYLTGILAHKAVDFCRRNARHAVLKEEWRKRCEAAQEIAPAREDVRKTILEIAMRQLMLDESIRERTKLIFHEVAVEGRAPEEVAAAYGISRNAVDQIKDRMVRKLREMVDGMEERHGG